MNVVVFIIKGRIYETKGFENVLFSNIIGKYFWYINIQIEKSLKKNKKTGKFGQSHRYLINVTNVANDTFIALKMLLTCM